MVVQVFLLIYFMKFYQNKTRNNKQERWAELAAGRACGCKFGNPQCRTLQNANVDEHSSALVTILSWVKVQEIWDF